MDEQPNAVAEDAPSPWWPCPECGAIEMRFVGVLERGRWNEDWTYQQFSPPDGRPTGIRVDEVTCVACGHTFNPITQFGWPSGPENGWGDTDG